MVQPQLVYQRWLECEALARHAGAPMWSWPVPLSDGRVILTLLYRPLREPSLGRAGPATVLLELSAKGDAEVWKPGAGYPAPVIFYANDADELFGLDLTMPGKIYACRVDGEHLFSMEASLRMDCLVAPRSFHQRGGELHWVSAGGVPMVAEVVGGGVPRGRVSGVVVEPPPEVHFPHTHLTRDGSLFVLDFDPMARVSRFRVMG